MTKADADNWKTPLGYYERAIAELSKAREEFQMELQTIREVQASQADLKEDLAELSKAREEFQMELKTIREVQASQADLKQQLQVTKEQLETIQKTANEFQARVATAEKAANDTESELENLKANLQPIRLESGVFSGNVKITPGWSGVLCCDRKGSDRFVRKYIRFSQSFSTSPNIVLGLSYVDVYQGANHRIKVIATDIDPNGFFLEIHTWRETQVWGTDVNWLAYGY